MDDEIQPQTSAAEQPSDFARHSSESKLEKSERGREPKGSETVQPPIEKPKKRKISAMNIIILIILLALIGVAVLYYLGDASKLGQCSSKEECGRYNVFYISGQGYVCANDQTAGESSIRTKILMFKYASKKATTNEPTDCSCVESQCEAIQ